MNVTLGRNHQGHLALGLHFRGENCNPVRNSLVQGPTVSRGKGKIRRLDDEEDRKGPEGLPSICHSPHRHPPETIYLAKLLTSTRFMKPQQNPQSRWTSVTSAGSSQQATLLRTIVTQQKGKKEVRGTCNTATRKKKMAPTKVPPIYTNPFLPRVLPKVMLPSIAPPRGPLVKAEEGTVEKPLIWQKKASSSRQQVEKVPEGALRIPTTCHSFHL